MVATPKQINLSCLLLMREQKRHKLEKERDMTMTMTTYKVERHKITSVHNSCQSSLVQMILKQKIIICFSDQPTNKQTQQQQQEKNKSGGIKVDQAINGRKKSCKQSPTRSKFLRRPSLEMTIEVVEDIGQKVKLIFLFLTFLNHFKFPSDHSS